VIAAVATAREGRYGIVRVSGRSSEQLASTCSAVYRAATGVRATFRAATGEPSRPASHFSFCTGVLYRRRCAQLQVTGGLCAAHDLEAMPELGARLAEPANLPVALSRRQARSAQAEGVPTSSMPLRGCGALCVALTARRFSEVIGNLAKRLVELRRVVERP